MTGFDAPFTHVRTLHDVWESALERHAKEKCLGTRGGEPTSAPGAYAFNTFEDVGRERAALSAAFAAFGIRAGDKVGLYSINCPEWGVVGERDDAELGGFGAAVRHARARRGEVYL